MADPPDRVLEAHAVVKISEFNELFPLLDEVKTRIGGSANLEQAAGKVLDLLMERLGDSIVLTRMFATIPYQQLPQENQQFVQQLAAAKQVSDLVVGDTPVLSLIATRGVQPAWNDRHDSEGHVGIPLVSADFVESIPMIARLLPEIGLELDWLMADAGDIDIKTLSKMSGVFYVHDAPSAVDQKGRKIISAQDFVANNSVKTVFGLGGGFGVGKTLLVLLFFCNEEIEKTNATRFLPLISTIKAETVGLVSKKAIFS